MHFNIFSIAGVCKLMGIKHVVLSPGSRSAPLVYAFASNSCFTIHKVVDERSAAFIALGIAQQSKQPVVLICTSGTAVANYFPAIAESFYQHIPLLVISADRPKALLNQQDGQMINQNNFYGTHIKSFYTIPELMDKELLLNESIKITLNAIQDIFSNEMGPVHINVPLSEPLYGKIPSELQLKKIESLILKNEKFIKSKSLQDQIKMKKTDFNLLQKAWLSSSKKVLLLGHDIHYNENVTSLLKLKHNNQIVILSDVASGQYDCATISNFDKLLASLSKNELEQLQPDLLISIGGPVLSKSLKKWLQSQKPNHHIRIQQNKPIVDTYNNVTKVIYTTNEDGLKSLASFNFTGNKTSITYKTRWEQLSFQLHKKVNTFIDKTTQWNELSATAIVLKSLQPGVNLQLANSSVVRYVSWLGSSLNGFVVNSNRGTSGIDGCTSTAVGAAMVNQRQTVLLTGDLAFLYDKNAFWIESIPRNLRVIVFNNMGGGIFSLIDGPNKIKKFTHYFTTPQKQSSVKDVAQLFGLDYYFCNEKNKLEKTLETFLNPLSSAAVLELKFDMQVNAKVFQHFKNIKL